eukprot:6172773-Prymnesium_polylepis.2
MEPTHWGLVARPCHNPHRAPPARPSSHNAKLTRARCSIGVAREVGERDGSFGASEEDCEQAQSQEREAPEEVGERDASFGAG